MLSTCTDVAAALAAFRSKLLGQALCMTMLSHPVGTASTMGMFLSGVPVLASIPLLRPLWWLSLTLTVAAFARSFRICANPFLDTCRAHASPVVPIDYVPVDYVYSILYPDTFSFHARTFGYVQASGNSVMH
jgi:hypothetical protein